MLILGRGISPQKIRGNSTFWLHFRIEDFEDTDLPKYAAVFSVYKNRDKEVAMEEAWELEKTLKSKAGYEIWLRTGRESIETPPSSASLRDIDEFNAWFNERKRHDDICGIFVMIM